MVVECSKGVGDVEAVVDRVYVAVEETVGVEVAVPEVLPAVEDEPVSSAIGRRGQRLDSGTGEQWRGVKR